MTRLVFPEGTRGWFRHPGGVIEAVGEVEVPEDVELSFGSWDARSLAGLDGLPKDQLVTVHIEKAHNLEPEYFAHLALFTSVRELWFSKSDDLTDACVRHLRGMRSLQILNLYRTAVTEDCFPDIPPSVRQLHLGMTRVTGGLHGLRHLRNLEWLSLEETDIDDEVIDELPALPALRKLVVFGTAIGDKALKRVRRRFTLQELAAANRDRRVEMCELERSYVPVLVRRLLGDVPISARTPRPYVRALLDEALPAGSVIRRSTGGELEWRGLDHLDELTRFLMIPHVDLTIVRPGGPVVQVPWMRVRGADRRAVAQP